jgi:hypothetical protein
MKGKIQQDEKNFPEKSRISTLCSLITAKRRGRAGCGAGQNFSGVPGRRRPAEKTITLARIKAIA